MNLYIEKKHISLSDIDIIDFIIPEIYRFFYLNLNPKLLKNWDSYFNSKYNWHGEDNKNNVLDILI